MTRPGEYRAGGTDVEERHRNGISEGPVVDLTNLPGLVGIHKGEEGSYTIGAPNPLVELENLEGLTAITHAVQTINPELRSIGTAGGELLQRTRCWYCRH